MKVKSLFFIGFCFLLFTMSNTVFANGAIQEGKTHASLEEFLNEYSYEAELKSSSLKWEFTYIELEATSELEDELEKAGWSEKYTLRTKTTRIFVFYGETKERLPKMAFDVFFNKGVSVYHFFLYYEDERNYSSCSPGYHNMELIVWLTKHNVFRLEGMPSYIREEIETLAQSLKSMLSMCDVSFKLYRPLGQKRIYELLTHGF